MKAQWLALREKFAQLTTREMALITLSGVVVIIMLPFNLSIDKNLSDIKRNKGQITKLTRENQTTDSAIKTFEEALSKDPNKAIESKIAQLESRLAKVDKQLLTLTQELVNPIEMRQALIDLLDLQKGVSLMSFSALPAEPLIFSASEEMEELEETPKLNKKAGEKLSLGLYRHGIKITLTGKYFQLRDYLQKIENLPWKFFWHDFNYQLIEYPKSELTIEIYSLSTEQEFIGV